eukprot:tig00021357_g20799.t2
MLNRTARVAAAHAEEIARRRVMGAEPPQAIKMEDGKMGHTTGIPVSPNGVFQHHNAIRSATRGDKKYSLLDDGSQAAYHAVDFGVRSLPAGLTEVYRSTVELHRSLVENLVDAESELTKAKATLATATEEAAKEAAQKAVQTRQAVVDKLRAEMPSDIIRGVPSYIKSLVRMIDPAERKRLKEELIAAYDGTQLDRIFANICDLIAFTDLPRDKTGHTVQALDVYDTLEQQITERKTLHHGLYSGLPYEQQRKANYDLALNLLPKLKTMAQDLSPTDGMTPKDKETWFNLFCTRAQSLIREAGFLIVTTTAGEPSIPTGNSKKGASINAANVDGYDYDNDGDDGYTAPYSGTPYTPPPSSSPAPSAPHSQLLGSSQPAPGHKPVPGCCDWHAPVPGKDYGNRPPIGRPYDYARTQTVTAIRTSQGYPRDARPRVRPGTNDHICTRCRSLGAADIHHYSDDYHECCSHPYRRELLKFVNQGCQDPEVLAAARLCGLIPGGPQAPSYNAELRRARPPRVGVHEAGALLQLRREGHTQNRCPSGKRQHDGGGGGHRGGHRGGGRGGYQSGGGGGGQGGTGSNATLLGNPAPMQRPTGPVVDAPSSRPTGPVVDAPSSRPAGPVTDALPSRPTGSVADAPSPRPTGPIANAPPPNPRPTDHGDAVQSGGPDSGRETEATTDSLAMVPIAPVQTVPITPTQPSASDIAHFVRDVNATTATQPVTSAAERTAPVPVAIPVAEPASPSPSSTHATGPSSPAPSDLSTEMETGSRTAAESRVPIRATQLPETSKHRDCAKFPLRLAASSDAAWQR